MRPALLALALAAAGCAQTAVFELQVELPPAPAGPDTWFAQTQIRNAARHPFDLPWAAGDPRSVELTAESQWDCISIISSDEALDTNVRVRFCHADDCLDLSDSNPPERRYTLEHPFYIGHRTYYRIQIPSIPDCTSTADCASRGGGLCVDGRCGCTTDGDCDVSSTCVPETGCVENVGRCSIEGCIEGNPSSFCSMDTGVHFCEREGDISRDSTYMCDLP